MEDLTGMRFGNWTVLHRAYDKTKSKGAKWMCRCDCGTEKIVFGKNLRNGASKSCSCNHIRRWIGDRFGNLVIESVTREGQVNIYHCKCDCGNVLDVRDSAIYGTESCGCSRRNNRVGERYGRLTVKDVMYNYRGDNVTYAVCDCDCGKENYITRLNGLRTGNTKSCGCMHNADLTGMVFGKLTVLGQIRSETPKRKWKCLCECGVETEAESYKLTSGHTKSCGCLKSEKRSRAEMVVRRILNNMSATYKTEHVFDDCIGVNGWHVRFDFYIPDHNLAIECDGEQHFKPVEFYGGEKHFRTTQFNDEIKNAYCMEHGITLLRIPYFEREENYSRIISESMK